MNISMTVLTDGRKEYIEQALPTWIDAYGDKIKLKAIIDDSGNTGYRHWLTETFPQFIVVAVGKDRCGYAPAMRKVFDMVRQFDKPYNLHIEDDFVLHNPPNLEDIVWVMDHNDDLSQMSLMRQAWYNNELLHGGVVEALEFAGSKFEECNDGGHYWSKHRSYFTCNPSVFPLSLAYEDWPDPPWCEMYFGQSQLAKGKSYGIWGKRGEWEVVEHIGRIRNGTEY